MLDDKIKKIIISHNGILGDTLVALPALWALREAFPNAKICYLYEKIPTDQFILANAIIDGSVLVDEFEFYEPFSVPFYKFTSIFSLFIRICRRRWDLGIVLQEPHWPARKKRFFRLCGVKRVLGPDGKEQRHLRDERGRLARVPHIADTLLTILRPLDISVPESGQGCMKLPINDGNKVLVDRFLKKAGYFRDRRLKVALAPWSNMPAKRWPLERFGQLVKTLISKYDVIPIVFGAPQERNIGEKLIQKWGRGAIAAGALGIKEGVELLSRCAFYLGNDTGTMHMAVCAGIPCVAIFSARDNPGRWEPYGKGHIVLRKSVPCEGCMLRECVENNMRCVMSITVEEVIEACRYILEQKSGYSYSGYRN